MQKFGEPKMKLCKKEEYFVINTEFLKTNAKFQQKKNGEKDLILKIQDSFSKWDLSTSPIDGLKQNINIDLRMTRRHQTIHRFA